MAHAHGDQRPRRGLHVFCPHQVVDSVAAIDPGDLFAHGIRGVIVDLDNTIVFWQKEEITAEAMAWLRRIQEAGMRLCIFSNSILGKRSERLAQRLGCFAIRRARKPGRKGFRRAMAMMETTPATTAMVGDQMFTDVWGGNRSGAYTIMVRPLHSREFVYTRLVSRPPERMLMRWFRKRGGLQ